MGYLRLSAKNAVCIVDGAQSPKAPFTATGHASALALEFSAGGHPVIVQCGSGHGFGVRSERSSRRGPSHSTVEIGGQCAATVHHVPGPRPLDELTIKGRVLGRTSRDASGDWAFLESHQYMERLGVQVERRLHLSTDGTRLAGEDTALATTAETRSRVTKEFPPSGTPCPMTIRFHLHPDVKAASALSGRAIALTLQDGTQWLMRADTKEIDLLPSHYFDESRPKPRATMQIVATTNLMEYWGRISWSLERLSGDRTRVLEPDT